VTAIRKHLRDFIAIVVIAALAAFAAFIILSNQRLRFPWEGATFNLKAAFSTAQAVTPGQGQTVRVSGVRVGDINKVALKDGRAIVTMALDPQYKDLVHTDAKALLRPKTGLKDMFIELTPGTSKAPLAKRGWTLPVSNTLPDVNPDEFLASLDSDTRDYLTLLIGGAGQGLKGRGTDLREVFKRFEPTHRDLAAVAGKVAERQQNLKHLVHSLRVLNDTLASKGPQLASLVDSSSAVFRAFASEDKNITASIGRFPGTLRTTTTTLGKVERFAKILRPAARDLTPTFAALTRANKAVQPFAKEAAPIIQTQIRPFVRDARPVVRTLKQPAADLATSTPQLTRSFTVLNHLFNLIGYNPNGREGPDKSMNTGPNPREEGYLFWIAWLLHNGDSVFSTSDANGPFRPITVGATCGTLKQFANEAAPMELQFLAAINDPRICPQ
jgi:phospholipid/cholesterol/gamma-HCH transport system substrate-binding protein